MERKLFYRYLWSAILTSLSGTLCVQIDGIIVSRLLGADAFAAIGSLLPLMQIQLTLCLLLGVGGALRLAYAIGAKDNNGIQALFYLTLIMLLLVSLPFIISSQCSTRIAGCFCHSETILPLASKYGRVLLISTPIYMLLQGSGALIRAKGFPTRVLVAVVIANILNLCMDVLFISVFNWGIAGAGWATTISNFIAIIIVLSTQHLDDFRPVRGSIRHLPDILIAGAPVAIGSIAMSVRLSYLTTTISERMDAIGMIIFSFLISIFLLINLLVAGITQALQPLAGQYLGAGDKDAFYRTCRRALNFSICASIIIIVIVILLANPLAILYGIPLEVDGFRPLLSLRIFACSFIGASINYVWMVIHQVMGNRVRSLIIAIVQPLLLIPVFALLINANIPFYHIWWAFAIAESICFIFILIISRHEIHSIYATSTRQ